MKTASSAPGRDATIDTRPTLIRQARSRPRLLACDIDGTLLDAAGTLRPAVREAIHGVARTGVHVMLATGRSPWGGVADIAATLGLRGPQVAAQGAVVSDPATGRVERTWPLPPDLYADVLTFAAALGLEPVIGFADGLGARPCGLPPPVAPDGSPVRLHIADDLSALAALHPVRVFLPTGSHVHQHVIAAASVWFAGRASLVWSDDTGVDLLAPGVTKWTGVAWVADRLGIPLGTVAAVGDGPNDIGMLRFAARSAVMASAPAHMRSVADIVVPGSAHDGVIDALAWFFPDTAIALGRPAFARPGPPDRQVESAGVA